MAYDSGIAASAAHGSFVSIGTTFVRGTFVSSAALVVEIRSPGDDTDQKIPFYAERGVDEVLIVDPQERRVHWFGLVGEEYLSVQRSGLIELGPGDLATRIDWP